MKPLNWIILGILAFLSIVFVAFYFMLGFDQVDWPQGLVLGIVWWAAIIAVGIGLHAQKRYFDKQDNSGATLSGPLQANGASPSRKNGASVGTVVMSAILIPTLALCPYFSANLGYADDVKDGLPSQHSATSGSSTSKASTESNASTAYSEKSTNTSASNNQFMSYYMLSIDTVGVDVFYSINDSNLEQLKPGNDFSVSFTDKIEFFVRPQVGYLTSSTFLHSANPNGFVDPDSSGIYSTIGENELPGFENAVKSALEIGCTKEFHFVNKGTSAITKYKYRQFLITAEPFEITATFNLEGGTLDGSKTYVDDDVYYGPDVIGHRLHNIINLPAANPVKEDFTFKGWRAADTQTLYPEGSAVDVQQYWRYLYDNSDSEGADLPFTAQWTEDVSEPSQPIEAPDSAKPDTSDSSTSGSTTTPKPSTPDNGNEAPGSSDEGPDANEDDDLKGSSIGSQATASKDPNSSSNSSANSSTADNANGSQASANQPSATAANPFAGDVEHGKKLAIQQRTAGSVQEGVPFKNAIAASAGALRDGIYVIEDIIVDDPVAQGYGIAYPNRGCWVCDYLKAGIVLTLVYGAVVMAYRAARRNRRRASLDGQNVTVGAVSA